MSLYAYMVKRAGTEVPGAGPITQNTAQPTPPAPLPGLDTKDSSVLRKGRWITSPHLLPGYSPRPHQIKAVNKLLENNGKMIMVHDTGTGKTSSAIYGYELQRHLGRVKKVVVITPAGLRENFAEGGVAKFTNSTYVIARRPTEVDPTKDYNIVSYETFRQDPVGIMQRSGADMIIADEFHRNRNTQTGVYQSLMAARPYAKSFIGLTASFINNNPSEIASLLSVSENNPALTAREFKQKFTQTVGLSRGFTGTSKKLVGIKDEAGFAKAVYPKVDFVATSDIPGNDMPRKQVTDVSVPMSDEQYRLYSLALKKLGPVKEYITRRDPNISVKDAEQVFMQIGQARQVANSVGMGRKDVTPEQSAERTPKVKKLLDDTVTHLAEKPDNNVVLYSNLVNGGIDVLTAGLKTRGIAPALFIGKGTEVGDNHVTEKSRQQGVRDYQDGKKRVIVISGAGAEGLNLPSSTAFFALDGNFNPERILQAEARARRLGGQAQRKPEDRVVDVRRYQSAVPVSERPGFFGRLVGRQPEQTTDEWMYGVARVKKQTSTQFTDTLHNAHKYIRKEYGPNGVKYVYREKTSPGLLGYITGNNVEPKPF